MARRFWVETLGCPKNQVDSDKVTGTLVAGGLVPAERPEAADVVVVNTCAFVEEARAESIEVILDLADRRGDDARLVVTGCLAERSGDELADALPEVDLVAGFGVDLVAALGAETVPVAGGAASASTTAVSLGPSRRAVLAGVPDVPSLDLLRLPRPRSARPWAYVKVAEGCDRACGFCAIPSFRGPQRSRTIDDVVAEVDALDVREVVLVAQDLAAFGRDQGRGERSLVPLVEAVATRVDRVRLLYLYPSDLTDALVDAVLATGVAYFDLSLQHASGPHLRRMRRWGDAERFLARIEHIRALAPGAAFRSNVIIGYPGETEADHDVLLEFLDAARLDWFGTFTYSEEPGTHAAGLEAKVPRSLMDERAGEVRALADAITAERRDELVGSTVEVLVDEPGVARSYREAPEIDGVIAVPDELPVGSLVEVRITGALGPDLEAAPVDGMPHVAGGAAIGEGRA